MRSRGGDGGGGEPILRSAAEHVAALAAVQGQRDGRSDEGGLGRGGAHVAIGITAGEIGQHRAVGEADAAARGLDLRLVCGRKEVERVLEVTGVRPLFRHYPTIEAALGG